MRFPRLWAALPMLMLALAPTARADDTAEFLKKDNWDGLMQYWTITDNSITGSAKVDPKFNTFLCSKQKYTDYELSFKVRLVDGKGNSGVQVRSTITDEKKFVVAGPQCDMGQQYWGSLYGEQVGGMMKSCPADFVQKHVKPDGVNDYILKVKGNHFTIQVNGETAVDADFPTLPNKKPTPADGIIAFQLHAGGPMTVEFTEIKFVNHGKK